MVKQLTGKILAMGLMMGAAVSAHAAATYSLTCETSRGTVIHPCADEFQFSCRRSAISGNGVRLGQAREF